jgi:hypothetical protein
MSSENFSGKSKLFFLKLVAFAVTIFVVVVALVIEWFWPTIMKKQMVYTNEPMNQGNPSELSPIPNPDSLSVPLDFHSPRLSIISVQKVSERSTEDRLWPTVDIFRTTGDQKPEFLARVGVVGEYPSAITLSPDKKYVLVNLESKVRTIDLATKQMREVYRAKHQALGAIFSQDSKQLFIWDQSYVQAGAYEAHIIDLSSGQDTRVIQGSSENPLIAQVWRGDGIVLMMRPMGEGAGLVLFDIKKGTFQDNGGYAFIDNIVSQSGQLMTKSQTSVGDLCNQMGGGAQSIFDVREILSQKKIATGGFTDRISRVISISSDNNEVLFSTEMPAKQDADCFQKSVKTFYLLNIATGKQTRIDNPQETIAKWNEYVVLLDQMQVR